jgi:hypothetical protein
MKASVRGRRDGDRDFFWYNKDTDTLGRKLGETAVRDGGVRTRPRGRILWRLTELPVLQSHHATFQT